MLRQHLLLKSLYAIFGLILIVSCPILAEDADAGKKDAQQLDVFLSEANILTVDRPIDDWTVAQDGIIKIEKVEGAPNQISVTGVATGATMLKVSSAGRSLYYSVTVTPAPVRIYINIPESKRLNFPADASNYSLSVPGVVKVDQPDDPKVLLISALRAGKTTLTVFVGDQIYRYYIATYNNRGADKLEIQNQFNAKGYHNLTIDFDNDTAIIGGYVPTPEELDDAVRIVKQFSQYYQVKATLGEPESGTSDTSEEEQIIVNNIKHIADLPNVIIRVKFPAQTYLSTATTTRETGTVINPSVVTTPQGGTIRGAGFDKPATTGNDLLEPKPLENVTETITVTKDRTIPEKIFLSGNVDDDLQEAKLLRVARTFCPFIVNFVTVRDPIALRVNLRFMQVDEFKTRNTGVDWGSSGPSITLGVAANLVDFNALTPTFATVKSGISGVLQLLGATGSTLTGGQISSFVATVHLYEQTTGVKLLRSSEVLLDNSQPGWYSEGEIQYYVSAATVSTTNPPVTTLTASPLFYGLNLDIAPINTSSAGGVPVSGQKLPGVSASVSQGSASYTVEESTSPPADAIGKLARNVQAAGPAPIIDNTTKYVDENGLIGLDISAQMSVPNGGSQVATGNGAFITLPDYFVRTTHTRAYLRDGQTVAVAGLIDHETTKDIQEVPFFANIPIFGNLFRTNSTTKTENQVVILVTPTIVRARDPQSKWYPKARYTPMRDMEDEEGDVPQIPPVPYTGNSKAMDLRPVETPPPDSKESVKDDKDSKDSKDNSGMSATTAPEIQPRASGGMDTVQPPVPASSTVDKPAPAKDNPPVLKKSPEVPSSSSSSSTLP